MSGRGPRYDLPLAALHSAEVLQVLSQRNLYLGQSSVHQIVGVQICFFSSCGSVKQACKGKLGGIENCVHVKFRVMPDAQTRLHQAVNAEVENERAEVSSLYKQ